jgi:hypothetical protein
MRCASMGNPFRCYTNGASASATNGRTAPSSRVGTADTTKTSSTRPNKDLRMVLQNALAGADSLVANLNYKSEGVDVLSRPQTRAGHALRPQTQGGQGLRPQTGQGGARPATRHANVGSSNGAPLPCRMESSGAVVAEGHAGRSHEESGHGQGKASADRQNRESHDAKPQSQHSGHCKAGGPGQAGAAAGGIPQAHVAADSLSDRPITRAGSDRRASQNDSDSNARVKAAKRMATPRLEPAAAAVVKSKGPGDAPAMMVVAGGGGGAGEHRGIATVVQVASRPPARMADDLAGCKQDGGGSKHKVSDKTRQSAEARGSVDGVPWKRALPAKADGMRGASHESEAAQGSKTKGAHGHHGGSTVAETIPEEEEEQVIEEEGLTRAQRIRIDRWLSDKDGPLSALVSEGVHSHLSSSNSSLALARGLLPPVRAPPGKYAFPPTPAYSDRPLTGKTWSLTSCSSDTMAVLAAKVQKRLLG